MSILARSMLETLENPYPSRELRTRTHLVVFAFLPSRSRSAIMYFSVFAHLHAVAVYKGQRVKDVDKLNNSLSSCQSLTGDIFSKSVIYELGCPL